MRHYPAMVPLIFREMLFRRTEPLLAAGADDGFVSGNDNFFWHGVPFLVEMFDVFYTAEPWLLQPLMSRIILDESESLQQMLLLSQW